jgi:hypothetical protein
MALFDINLTIANISGITIQGWSDDTDALSLPEIESIIMKTGADGGQTGISNGVKGGEVIIKLRPDSPTVKPFGVFALSQQNGVYILHQGYIRFPDIGVNTVLENGRLTKFPSGITLGKGDVGNQVFTFTFEKIKTDYSAANFL